MNGTIDIISYTNYRDGNGIAIPRSIGETEISSTSDHGKGRKDKRIGLFNYIEVPAFLEKPFQYEMTIVSRRLNYMRRNLLRDFFLGHAFFYPFTVCI